MNIDECSTVWSGYSGKLNFHLESLVSSSYWEIRLTLTDTIRSGCPIPGAITRVSVFENLGPGDSSLEAESHGVFTTREPSPFASVACAAPVFDLPGVNHTRRNAYISFTNENRYDALPQNKGDSRDWGDECLCCWYLKGTLE